MDGRELLGATLHGASGISHEEISERDGAPLGITPEADASERTVLTAFDTASDWLNSPPLTASGLRGHVVLVQFWTYTCINWLRTLPYVRAWYERYGANTFTVVGVHTPEFGFERDVDNVRRAAKSLDVPFPIVIDSDYAIWTAFENNYWPALYFVGANGRLRGHHFGEEDYERSERTIQRLLTEAGVGGVGSELVSVDPVGFEVGADWETLRSPEKYVGYERTTNFASPGGLVGGRHVYAAPPRLDLNEWALTGDWTVEPQAAASNESGGRIAFRFQARDLHLVMAPPATGASVSFRVFLDGQPPGADHGTDVNEQGDGAVTEPRLYQLVRQAGQVRERTFEIEFAGSGIEAFAFTFG
jgi:thiol-disulfide isomerase/thioredoxin